MNEKVETENKLQYTQYNWIGKSQMWFAIFLEKRYNSYRLINEVRNMLLLATYKDLLEIDNLAELVISDMEKANIPQWKKGYPAFDDFKKDIDNSALYIYQEDNAILGTITILPENDPPYKTINSWLKEKSIVIHRMLVHPDFRNKGIAKILLDEAIHNALSNHYESIKIDTHLENYKMRSFLKKNGFIELEYLKVIDRLAYEKVLED